MLLMPSAASALVEVRAATHQAADNMSRHDHLAYAARQRSVFELLQQLENSWASTGAKIRRRDQAA